MIKIDNVWICNYCGHHHKYKPGRCLECGKSVKNNLKMDEIMEEIYKQFPILCGIKK